MGDLAARIANCRGGFHSRLKNMWVNSGCVTCAKGGNDVHYALCREPSHRVKKGAPVKAMVFKVGWKAGETQSDATEDGLRGVDKIQKDLADLSLSQSD